MKNKYSAKDLPPTARSNEPLAPGRTIEPRDMLRSNQFYAPCYQEQKAIAAMAAGKKQEAIDWYDRAILDDPERGHRIYRQSVQYNFSPGTSAYSLFCLNFHDVEYMKTRYREGLLNICYRSVESAGKSYKEATPMCDELMERMHIWDNLPPPQYTSAPAPSVAPEQTKLKKQ